MKLDLTALLGDISEQPEANEKTATLPVKEPPAAAAQITLLEGQGAPVWTDDGWAKCQAIYNAVESLHRRHRSMDGSLQAWKAVNIDLGQVYKQFNRHPLAFGLLNAMLAELERTAPPPGKTEEINITQSPAYARYM